MTVDGAETKVRRKTSGRQTSIKEDCVQQAMKVIADKGLEALSLREVARNLGVSHQAPYKHFESRDHLLAEVIRRCLREFGEALRGSRLAPDGQEYEPVEAMRRLGSTYLTYAARNPLAYRLMFGTPWPQAAQKVDLEADSRAAFDVLVDRLSKVKTYNSNEELKRDALFVWSAMHGIASVIESEAMARLEFTDTGQKEAVQHAMALIDKAVFGEQAQFE